MLKIYKGKSQVAIGITLPNGAHKHVSFSPITEGGSVYMSNDAAEQWGLEHHTKYGKLYVLKETKSPVSKEDTAVPKKSDAVAKKAEKKVLEIPVADINEAKDYLCDTYGMSRTKLRSQKSIIDAATAKGIVFKGI